MQLLNMAVKPARHLTKPIVVREHILKRTNLLFAWNNFNEVDLKYTSGPWSNIIYVDSFPAVGLGVSDTKGTSYTTSRR